MIPLTAEINVALRKLICQKIGSERVKSSYDEMVENNDPWIVNIKNELNSIGLLYLFVDSSSNDTRNMKLNESRIKDIYVQTLLANIRESYRMSVSCVIWVNTYILPLRKEIIHNMFIKYCISHS